MSISSTRKVSMGSPSLAPMSSARSQLVEDIDTRNNVLVRDDSQNDSGSRQYNQQPKSDFLTPEIDNATSIDALTISGVIEEEGEERNIKNNQKVNVYSNNQSIIKDEDVERIGRSYLKRFYEQNEPITDVNELV